jgi:alkylhydroperoxidase/carboxymuconolactone decarboxylase family protein YurZ
MGHLVAAGARAQDQEPGRDRQEIREVCLTVGLYAGIPAANDAHKIALEVLQERGIRISR